MTAGAELPGADPPATDPPATDPAAADARAKPRKAPNAFRTISEVADDLHIPQHVLRFWETKFPQVKPLKRGGGRRYYRPDDITLLRRISDLLYTQGYTIKGVQRLLREGGGKLSDNIPPPPPGEGHEVDGDMSEAARTGAMGAEPMFPLSGLAARSSGEPAQATSRAARAKSDAEVERLRRVLADVLRELEQLRASLAF